MKIAIPVTDYRPDNYMVACGRGFTKEADLQKARELGGLVSGEHGIGYAKKQYMKEVYSEDLLMLMRRVKLAFDPNNILNPEKII